MVSSPLFKQRPGQVTVGFARSSGKIDRRAIDGQAVGHVIVAGWLGAIPGVFIGAQLSSRAPDHGIRPALILMLLASSSKLLGASNVVAAVAVGVAAATMLTVSWGLSAARRKADAEKALGAQSAAR